MRCGNFTAGIAGSAPPVYESGLSELQLRILSAIALAPIALAAIYFGTPYLELLLIFAGFAMAWEWDRLCGGQIFGASGGVVMVAIASAGAAALSLRYEVAMAALAVGLVATYAVARWTRRDHPGWISAGTLVIGVPCLAVMWLRSDAVFGLQYVVWLVGVIWATDLTAYCAGRLIGGARLAPSISPGKTWAGLIGAVVGAGLWGFAWGLWFDTARPWLPAVIGGFAAVLAQGGDLGVSCVKRRFGVKDASNLIPGHGGVLDRFDGMLTTGPALALLVYATRGGLF